VKAQEDGVELLKHVAKMKETLGSHIFREDHIIPVDDFPSKWEEHSQVAFQRIVIKF
jgi:hypothetical protein